MKLEWGLGGGLAFLLALVLAVAGATWFFSQGEVKAEALTELSKLTVLANNEDLEPGDLSRVKALLASDSWASHEIEEVRVLTVYKEFVHASHGMSLVAGYLRTGRVPVCTGHYLAHYYVFSRNGELELAEHELEHARESFPEWAGKARASLSREEFKDYNSNLNSFFYRVGKGATDALGEEVYYLAEVVPCFS